MYDGRGVIIVSRPKWRLGPDRDSDEETILKEQQEIKEEVKEPPRYKVLMHNDDFTPINFVFLILQEIFHYDSFRSELFAYYVQEVGVAVVGIYPFEIAETKVNKAMSIAQEAGYPLLFEMEKE
jgi:ATP-dependent Clp protease adaptor protein ClpS